MEKSGTTLLSQLLNGHPNIASGVELGFLLSNILDFKYLSPFYDWMTADNWGWGITVQDREKLMTANSFDEMYFMLNEFKGKNHQDTYLRQLFESSEWIYDKTPKYIYHLNTVMKKVDRPFIITFKTPLEGIAGVKKRGANVDAFLRGYARALRQITRASERAPDRLLVVKYRSLATDPTATMNAVKRFIGIDDDIELSLERYNERFGKAITSRNSFHNDVIVYTEPAPHLSESENDTLVKFMCRHQSRLHTVENIAI